MVAKYGVKGGRIKGGGSKAYWWWKELRGVRKGVGVSVGGWFEDGLLHRVSNSESTSFWIDLWLNGEKLCY